MISTGAISIKVFTTARQAGVRVRDTGQGIHPDFLPHLFEDFKQESTGHARKHEGNGLGLSITKRLVEQHGGSLEVDSAPGRGATFYVLLPPSGTERANSQPAAPPDVAAET